MTSELMPLGTSVDERSRRTDGGNRDIEVVDRYMGKGSIIPGVTPISAS
jgi:hypothetical protein